MATKASDTLRDTCTGFLFTGIDVVKCTRARLPSGRHGAEQYAGDLECVFYGYHLDRAILKIAEAAYCLMPSLPSGHALDIVQQRYDSNNAMAINGSTC